ncbi:zinc finger protein 469 [Rousettus aegyptiacus]|uniref:zinc finger protein 469 n=1 Tax=Rousettus aegyptiacus TaxID=9407 RepID=UPI00168D71AF|nr:zinc finger protein 469 [Rousettus aegyptiacus]XP_015984948.2 zinc finger protein 469 [Rousettus aegyptiacus]
MPGEQPRGAPPPIMTGGLQPCQTASGIASGSAAQPPGEDGALASRSTKAIREAGSGAQALEPPDTQPQQAREAEPKAPLPRTHPLIIPHGKGSSPRAPPGRIHTQAPTRRTSRADSSPKQLYSLSIVGSRARPALDETPEGPQREAPQPPEAEAPPAPEELNFQRCFQETPSSFTSTNYTSPSTTPGPPPLRAPQSSDASPCRPASYSEFQASGATAWPPTAENNFPGASFGVSPTEPEPFPEGSSPRVASFQFPFPALHGVGPKSFPEDTAGPKYSKRALVCAFPQPQGAWPEEAVSTCTAYPLPSRPAPQTLPCYPSQPSGLNSPSDLGHALPQPGAAHPAPHPFSESTATFPDSLHKSLTKALPERPPSAHNGLGSPRGPPNSLPQRHFPGQVYGSPRASRVGSSPGSLDTELATPGHLPTRQPQLWDPATAPYSTPPLGPPSTARSVFFEGQSSPGQRLGLPQSPPMPWPQVLPATGPNPHRVEMLSRLPLPPGAPEWQGGSQGALGAASKTPGPGEKLALLRNSPGQHGSGSPGLFTYNGLQDPGAQPLFFGMAQPQVSPRGTPGLPPARLVGASPSESPLPSPATNTAGSSTCSSLSPLSSSPANPSSEESQLPGPLGPSTFFQTPTHRQETSSPFPSPEPSHTLPVHYQPEPVKAFPFPTEGLGAKGAFKCLEEAPFPSTGPDVGSGGLEGFPPEPPPYSAHHFPLSSASLDQLDVLLTCKQCDRNYSSLAAFLEHRQFCSLLLAKTQESHQQPSGLPTPPAAPSVLASPKAPTGRDPSLLSHTKTVPFLLGGDVRVDGKDDPLRTSFLPGLAAAPFPLPASDLDLEDDAKLDSLITEALNGLEYQSDNPEIDSSFIDVFADEEPSGPRGPSSGQLPKTRVGAMPENKAQLPLPAVAAPLEPQEARPGNRSYLACNRPKTRSLGPVPAEADGASLASQKKKGKQFKFFRKELGTANTTKRPGRSTRATCLRTKRKGNRAEPAPPHPRDLRTQGPKGHTNPSGQALPVETRSSKRLRLSPGKDSRRRKTRSGTWSKELIHKIVQQKNQLHRRQVRQNQDGRLSLATQRPEPSTLDGGLQEYDYASESEEEDVLQPRGSRFTGQPRHGSQRWHRGEKRKEVDLTPGSREDREQQKPKRVVKQETKKPSGPCPGSVENPEAEVGPEERSAKHLLQVPTSTKTPEESRPSLDFPQETKNSEIAEEFPPDTTKLLRGVSSSSPATHVEGSPCPPAPEQPQPGRENTMVPHRSSPAPGAGSLLSASPCTELPISGDKEDPPAYLPRELLVPVINTTTAYPEPNILFLKTPDLDCDPALFNRDSVVPATKKGPQPYSSPHSELLLGPKELAGCFPKDLYSKPSALDTLPASNMHLRQDGVDTGPLKPKPPRSPPYIVDTDPHKAKSLLASESTPLLSGLPVDGFNSPIYSSLSGNEDTNSPSVCTETPQRKPQLDPPYPSLLPEKGWALLEEVSNHLGHFPDLSGEKAFSKKRPCEETVATSPSPLPSKVSECSIAFMNNLSEDELEIKRLVTELESQLQSQEVHEAPGELCGAEHKSNVCSGTGTPLPGHQATLPRKDTFSATDLTGLEELSPHQEGAETAVATKQETLGSPKEEWPSFHLGEAAPLPSTHRDRVSGAPFSPPGASLSFQPVQNVRISRTGLPEVEESCRVHPEACLPDPREPLKSPSERGSLVKCSPNHEPLLPQNDKATRIHHGKDILLLLPCTQRRGLLPGSLKAQGPCRDAPELEALGSPVAHLAPDLAFQGARVLHLGATPPSGASHSDTTKGLSVSITGRPEGAGPRHPLVGGLGSEDNKEFVPVGGFPNPACVPDASPGRRPQDPATSPLCQLQLLVARAAENENDSRGLQGPLPANTQNLQQSNPSDLEGDSIEGGNVAHSPAKGSDRGMQITSAPEMARCQLGPETDGHLGLLSQAEKLKGQGKASQLQPDYWGTPEEPNDLATVNAHPETTQASPAGAANQLTGQLQGSRAALGLQNEARAIPSPTSDAAAHSQNEPEDWAPEEAASPGLKKHLFLSGESPEPPMSNLARCVPLPISVATPVPCGLEHLLQEDSPTTPSGEPRGLVPAYLSCRDPTSPKPLPACSSAWTTPKRADCTPAPTDDGVGGPPAAPSSLRTSPFGLKESLACCPLLGEHSSLEDPPLGQPSFINVFTPTHVGDHLKGHISRTLESSRKERPRGSSVCDAPPPPRVTIKAVALPSIPATGMAAVGGPRAECPDQRCRGTPPHTSPDGMPKGPSLEPPGNGEGQSTPAVPADPSAQGTAGPEPHACWEDQVGASSQGQEELETPGAEHPGITKASEAGTRSQTVTCSYKELHPGRATSLSSTASNSRTDSPQSLRNVLYQMPQEDTLCSQDRRQKKPRGFKKRPVSTENGHWKDQDPSGQPVTCEVCLATFRSRPGLSRHRARKHGLHRGATSQPTPLALPTPQMCRTPGKKSRRAPVKEKLKHGLSGPSHTAGSPPIQGSTAAEDIPGPDTSKGLRRGLSTLGTPRCPSSQEPQPPDLVKQRVEVSPAEPRKRDRLERNEPRPKQAERGGGQRRGGEPTDVPSKSEGKSNKKARKPRTRRFQEDSSPPVSPDVISDRSPWNPSAEVAIYPAPPSHCLSPEEELETELIQPPLPVATDLGKMATQKSPGNWVTHPGKMEGVTPGEGPGEQKAALARGCQRSRDTKTSGIYREPLRAAKGKPARNSRVAKSKSGQGVWEGHKAPSGPPGPPENCGSEAGSTISTCLQSPLCNPEDRVQEHEGVAPEAPGSGLKDPHSLFDDEASFSQLFPLGNRLTRKKNPRVYGKRCKKAKPPPPLEPSGEFQGSTALSSARLPTDLSDSGSLCLSHEDPWSDEAMSLPESFLLEGFLSSKMPGIDPWAPGPRLWALEPDLDADYAKQGPSCSTEDHPSENIPELHMVPEAWRGLELQPPTDETTSSFGDMSPEPPNLEREHYDCGLPGNTMDLESFSAKLEMQDLCFLGPCEDPVGLPSMSFLDFKSTANSQGPQSERTEEAAGARRTPGRHRQAKAGRVPYKCKVCFQRFHSLGELDLHKLAHSPSPPPTCYMCVERRFGSRELLRDHLQEKHVQGRAGLWACGMCLREVADIWMYNEHLREHALRFARKGPSRRSLGDPSRCWEGDSTVTRFLSSIMGQVSKPHRGKRSVGQANEGLAEREREKSKARANNSNQDCALMTDSTLANSSPSTCKNPTPPSSSATLPSSTKTCPNSSPDPCSSRELLLHTIPVHQDCKDPSRDCHHCGKRFPKPFKLQRHLAVHSPQRVFLCPQCPLVYPEPRELRMHLAREHGVKEEQEMQHTLLYTCELCANVTNISKRSFVCSSCNYTFTKKEQFDRHMDKHLRRGQQPFTFRGVRRPGAPGQKAPAREGTLPSKRRKVATPSSTPGPVVDQFLPLDSSPTLSEVTTPAPLQPCLDAAPGGIKSQPRTPERPMDPVSNLVTGSSLPSDPQELLLPSLSPFPAASAGGKNGHRPERAQESHTNKASPGSPRPLLQQAFLVEGYLPQPGARGQTIEEQRPAGLFSGKCRTPSTPGKCAPAYCPEAPSLLQKKQVSTCPMVPEGNTGGSSHKGSAAKYGSCWNSSKDRLALSTPNKAPKFPVPSKKAMVSPTPGEPTHGTEDKQKPTALKTKPGPNNRGQGGQQHSTKTAGGSQPQPASGQLQSETATTPAKPNCLGQNPTPGKPLTRAPAKGYSKAPREAGNQRPQGSPGPREDGEGKEKKRKGRALGPTKNESVGSLGRAPSVPDKPPRAPRKQATPSRVLPSKTRPSSQNSTTLPQPSEQQKGEPGHSYRDFRRSKDGLGKAFPQARPLHRPPKRGRAIHGAEPANPRACWTAASQSDLLSQLFGQRLTSFKIPLKKDPSE